MQSKNSDVKEIIIATKNKGKVDEFKHIFKNYDIEATSLLDLSIDTPEVEETGETFKENAQLKAEGICSYLKKPVIADDSGLVIDALNGKPGIHSARYAGDAKNDHENIKKVLKELEHISMEDRTARFVCVLAIARPGHQTIFQTGNCEGTISFSVEGKNGFGYDPIFIPTGYTKTMAQLTDEEKNQISHRRNAIQQMEKWLDKFFV